MCSTFGTGSIALIISPFATWTVICSGCALLLFPSPPQMLTVQLSGHEGCIPRSGLEASRQAGCFVGFPAAHSLLAAAGRLCLVCDFFVYILTKKDAPP